MHVRQSNIIYTHVSARNITDPAAFSKSGYHAPEINKNGYTKPNKMSAERPVGRLKTIYSNLKSLPTGIPINIYRQKWKI